MKITWRWLPPAAVMLAGVALTLLPAVGALTEGHRRISGSAASMSSPLDTATSMLVSAGDQVQRGDVIVFTADSWPDQPAGNKLVKRVVGIGGDTVSWDAGDKLHINGVRVEEPYVRQDGPIPVDLAPSAVVPPGTVFVVGDWRDNSRDSRLYIDRANNGAIPLSAVVGRVVATDSGPLPQTRAFIDAGLAAERPVENPWPGRLALFGGIAVFLVGTVWLGLRLRKRPTG